MASSETILIIDDEQRDIDQLTEAYPGRVVGFLIPKPDEGLAISSCVESALEFLSQERDRSQILVFDLQWISGASHYDGEGFLYEATERGLLKDIFLVCWTRFPNVASSLFANQKFIDYLRDQGGVSRFVWRSKADIPENL